MGKDTSYVNNNNAERPDGSEYSKVIQSIAERSECPFCLENLHKTHTERIIIDGKYWIATKNAFPYKGAKHHFLFIHKKHIESVEEISRNGWRELQDIVIAITGMHNIAGAALFMRYGDTKFTGATVNHLHAQLVSGHGVKDSEPVLARLG